MAVPSSVSESLRSRSVRGISAGHSANDNKEAEATAPAHLCKGLTRFHLSSITLDGCTRQACPLLGEQAGHVWAEAHEGQHGLTSLSAAGLEECW